MGPFLEPGIAFPTLTMHQKGLPAMSPRTIVTALATSLVVWHAGGRVAPAVESYVADPVHSSIVYRVKHMNVSYFWGRFDSFAGAFTLDEANPVESQFEFSVKVDSIDTANAKRDQHLKSPDFFNAVQFPTITFKSQSVKKTGDAYEVVGDLMLLGVTKPVTVKVVPTGKGKGPTGAPIAGIEATLSLKRSDFGMNKMVGVVSDDVWVTVGIEGQRK
jgi:polyisoprenoid-binding protein YceI